MTTSVTQRNAERMPRTKEFRFRLHLEEDRDIIEAIESAEPGLRAYNIRRLLRIAIRQDHRPASLAEIRSVVETAVENALARLKEKYEI